MHYKHPLIEILVINFPLLITFIIHVMECEFLVFQLLFEFIKGPAIIEVIIQGLAIIEGPTNESQEHL